jgi:hypothetical protein
MRIFLVSIGCSTLLLAAPEGMRVEEGKAIQIKSTIQTESERTVLHWKRFSLEETEKLHFEQPNRQSAVLNRVLGDEQSLLHGHLTSNGEMACSSVLLGASRRMVSSLRVWIFSIAIFSQTNMRSLIATLGLSSIWGRLFVLRVTSP